MAVATAGLANNRDSIWARLSRYSDLLLAAAVCAVVGMLIVPLPEWLLDLLIITNLSLGLVMLMVAVYARDALQFSVFPSLLLLTTLFRLGLDISATRLILLQAHAGQVVTAFGNFVVGGFVIGVLQLKMAFGDALGTSTLLTVGEGLTSQIPALLISTATGMIVTRAASEPDSNLGKDVTSQLFSNPRVLGIVGGLLLLMSLVPGLPKIPFIAIGLMMLGGAQMLRKNASRQAAAEAMAASAPAANQEPE